MAFSRMRFFWTVLSLLRVKLYDNLRIRKEPVTHTKDKAVETYDQIRRNMTMCEALRELMKDEIEAEVEAARSAAEREGRENGWLE